MSDTPSTIMVNPILEPAQQNLLGLSTISGPTYVMTMEQLLASHANIVQQENADKSRLSPLITPDTNSLTPAFMNWTSQGFPNIYILFSIQLAPPTVCADGVVRNVYDYVSYLLGKDLSAQIQQFDTNFLDMTMSYTISGNIVNVHVSRGPV